MPVDIALDWGGAGWGDPAYDFGGISLRAVPYLLDGYRQVMPVENDETAEARILWRHLTLALDIGARQSKAWARASSFLGRTAIGLSHRNFSVLVREYGRPLEGVDSEGSA